MRAAQRSLSSRATDAHPAAALEAARSQGGEVVSAGSSSAAPVRLIIPPATGFLPQHPSGQRGTAEQRATEAKRDERTLLAEVDPLPRRTQVRHADAHLMGRASSLGSPH